MKKILMPLAPGFEEIEALAVVDILRRAGVEVVIAGTTEGLIEGRNLIKVEPDCLLDEVVAEEYEMIVLAGGKLGTENLKKDSRVIAMIKKIHESGRYVTAICAAPVVLKAAGVIDQTRLTAHPSVASEFAPELFSTERVVTDGNIVTSQGPGTAIEFAYELVRLLVGPEKVAEINAGVLARD